MESSSAENYLKLIYAHTEWQPEPITPSTLAGKLGIAPSSVTQMVGKLVEAGMVSRVPYGPLTLTEAGIAAATAVVRRHRLIETWLVQEMGYTWDAVHNEAEVLEHAISDRLLEAIDLRLGRPSHDPHGDPIPGADGSIARGAAVLLADAAPGSAGTIVRIDDKDPELLRGLAARGVGLDSPVRVAADGSSRVAASGSTSPIDGAGDSDASGAGADSGDINASVVLEAAAASAIWITA
ncbi:MAG: metal-dependent transcriptional regulator [Microbacteriaceae bacterium]